MSSFPPTEYVDRQVSAPPVPTVQGWIPRRSLVGLMVPLQGHDAPSSLMAQFERNSTVALSSSDLPNQSGLRPPMDAAVPQRALVRQIPQILCLARCDVHPQS